MLMHELETFKKKEVINMWLLHLWYYGTCETCDVPVFMYDIHQAILMLYLLSCYSLLWTIRMKILHALLMSPCIYIVILDNQYAYLLWTDKSWDQENPKWRYKWLENVENVQICSFCRLRLVVLTIFMQHRLPSLLWIWAPHCLRTHPRRFTLY